MTPPEGSEILKKLNDIHRDIGIDKKLDTIYDKLSGISTDIATVKQKSISCDEKFCNLTSRAVEGERERGILFGFNSKIVGICIAASVAVSVVAWILGRVVFPFLSK